MDTNINTKEARMSLVKAFGMGGVVPKEDELERLMEWIDKGEKDGSGTVPEKKAVESPTLRVTVQPDTHQYDSIIIQSNEFAWPENVNGRRITKCLVALNTMNVMTIGDLRSVSRQKLLSCRGVGKQTVEILETALAGYGIKW